MKKYFLGRATTVALVVAIGIGGYSLYQHHRAMSQPPIIQNRITRTSPGGSAPAPEFITRHARELELTPAQAQQVAAVAVAYRKEIAPARQRMQAAADDYVKFVERHNGGTRPLNMEELQQHAGKIQQLSSVVVTTRHTYWQQACAVLTAHQRQQVDALVKRATLKDLQ